jgi:glycine/D-amino acid oxidase-like deaminating enzyme
MSLPPPRPRCATECGLVLPIDARVSNIQGIYACTRPFRHAGPRIEVQRIRQKNVVHNYGHGGAGWSVSWGSSRLALRLAQNADTGMRRLGVIGCGPLGLTSAILAQRAGLSVCIYTKAVPPEVSSMGAVGMWSPDSRFCDAQHAASWDAGWRQMANDAFAMHQSMLQLPNHPIEWFSGYKLSDAPFDSDTLDCGEPEYAKFKNDFLPPQVDLPAATHPFPQPYARCWTGLMFNITLYAEMLMSGFVSAGGEIVIREFQHPDELSDLNESTLINATGYGARALFNDDSIIPVRGQTVRLAPQPKINYGLRAHHFLVVPRRDGLVVQDVNERGFFNNDDDTPDQNAAEEVIEQLAEFVTRMQC